MIQGSPLVSLEHCVMADKPSFFEDLRAQLETELERDAAAVIKGLASEEATRYLQSTWVEGKGLRDPEEIDRIGPDEWWKQYFEHIAPNATDLGKEVFYTSIKGGIPYMQAVEFATKLGGMEPEPAPQPALPEPSYAPPEMAPPPMPEAPPMEMAPPPPEGMVP